MRKQPATPLQNIARVRIKQFLESNGISQAALGQAIGRSQEWVSRFLAGRYDADVDTLQAIATAIDLPLYELLALTTDPRLVKLCEAYLACRPSRRPVALRVVQELADLDENARR